jgi:ubiquinone/menaquinone biosynthesis C-methylase UbiE
MLIFKPMVASFGPVTWPPDVNKEVHPSRPPKTFDRGQVTLGIKMKIDYNKAAETYDNTRSASARVVEAFHRKIGFSQETKVLDFGCGTGNFLFEIQSRYGATCFGVEPSDEMSKKAAAKSAQLTIRSGNHADIPFADGFFDFIYMTDVIHHIPDLALMFSNLNTKLKPGARVCVVTESHEQINARWYNHYFADIEKIEGGRYPAVPAIVSSAAACSLSCDSIEILNCPDEHVVENGFIENVRQKNYSMFRLLEERAFDEGFNKLCHDLGKVIVSSGGGLTLVWLKK